MVEARDAVEARELTETPEDLTEAVEGRVDLAETLPGIFLFDRVSSLFGKRIDAEVSKATLV